MTYIKIQTLTPVHIGSGRAFQGNFEYLYFSQEKKVAVIDEQKVFAIIGRENLDKWLTIIERKEDLLQYLQVRRPGVSTSDTALRTLPVIGKGPSKENTIREQIHSGNGSPILPGSSLKGAIRTALLAHLIKQQPDFARNHSNLGEERRDNRTGEIKTNYKDRRLQANYLGSDPNHDILRLLRVGDVHFEETCCLLAETLNQGGNGFRMKDEVKQFIECLPEKSIGIGRLQIPEKLKSATTRQNYFQHDTSSLTYPLIFRVIRENTLRLLEREIANYEDQELPAGADEYLESLRELRTIAAQCGPHECVIRVGFGIGHQFMTGGWQIDQLPPAEMRKIALAVRRKDYGDLPFPKSRKVMLQGRPMGFMKLTLLDEEALQHLNEEKEALRQQRAREESLKAAQFAKAEAEQKAARLAAEEEAIRKAEEARKPQLKKASEVSLNIRVDAVVLRMQGIQAVCRLYVEGYESKEFPVRYPAGLAKDTVVTVKINDFDKQKKIIRGISEPIKK